MKSHHEIVCPEYALDDGSSVVVIPWFLIPGRPYPIQVYLSACDMYSTNPGYGQRAVAEATKRKFKLEKFSHSTVCRSFKKIEQFQRDALDSRLGGEFRGYGDRSKKPADAPAGKLAIDQKEASAARRFPTVEDTARRRAEMAIFLQTLHNTAAKYGGIEAAGIIFVKYWHGKTKRLLI
jgi:hypothetical protein